MTADYNELDYREYRVRQQERPVRYVEPDLEKNSDPKLPRYQHARKACLSHCVTKLKFI